MKFLYGADYNPEQWKNHPEILKKDIELMKKAGCNIMSIGIFGWSEMEKTEGEYDFSFYDYIINNLFKNGIKTILATPSGARPNWLAQKYPEVLRVDENGVRHRFGARHNHCLTSPIYRQKTAKINEKLAEHYADNPAIFAWHVSNEYNGCCYCELCAEAFRAYLKKRYDNDLERLNYDWWNTFWSHTYTDWKQIEPPMNIGESRSNSLLINWKRFVTYQTIDFYKNEIEPLKRIAPHIPVTTNFHGDLSDLDYFKFQDHIDFASWDAYPMWGTPDGNLGEAIKYSFIFDLCRSIKQKPFLLMESTPSNLCVHNYNKPKRPGVNKASSLLAIAHGSDSVQYFQWRKSRGSCEQFHGAVVDNSGSENTRVFKEAADIGETLKQISAVCGSSTNANAAVIFDWENRWALDFAVGFQKNDKKYVDECIKNYKIFWKHGINTDVIDSEQDFSKYKIIAAPMLFMIKPNVVKRLKDFVEKGGILISGFISGYVNDDGLSFTKGICESGFYELFGIENEEIDTLYPNEKNTVAFRGKSYAAYDYCEVIHSAGAKVLAEYADDYYAGYPAVTVNTVGNGAAYYVAFRGDDDFIDAFYSSLNINRESIRDEISCPNGVGVNLRSDDSNRYLFIQNWNDFPVQITLKSDFDDITGHKVKNVISMQKYETIILKKHI